ncbi:hypothetical protein [Bradyrhizobium sp. CCGE-LA001]|uniref:hypothetical protein n=1 Tax=Bradyrhizobium sp. CCGE-LA001 TaxID=1223566 RepID=UPI0002AA6D43|nr:hypothetical protein [Bradyrhizobium sp. CCGE-LA001]
MIQRYSFLKFPSADDFQKESQVFAVGKFGDVLSNELSVYGDGTIVAGRCGTEKLEAFIEDLFGMVQGAGYSPATVFEPEMYLESSVIVRARNDLTIAFGAPPAATDLIKLPYRSRRERSIYRS